MAPAPKKRITSRRDVPWTVAELTGFTVELWARICRLKAPDCLRDKPVHLTFDTLCGFPSTACPVEANQQMTSTLCP